MSTKAQDAKQLAEEAVGNKKNLANLISTLSSGSRRERQQAASAIALVAKSAPAEMAPHIGDLVDALNRPEAQTRWEALETLALMVPQDARACEKAIEGAETGSEKIWPLIDEGIQCYHGDLEFQDMLLAVTDFSCGKLSPEVKAKLAERMRFDAENGKGALQKRAAQIVENIK